MLLRFIGANGSMGLKYGSVYNVNITSNHLYIIVEWEDSGIKRICPYTSPATLNANWAKL